MKFLVTPDMRVYNMGQMQLPLCIKPYYSMECKDTNSSAKEVFVSWLKNDGPCGWFLSYDDDVLVKLESTEQGELLIRSILDFLPSSDFTVIYINKDLTVSAI